MASPRLIKDSPIPMKEPPPSVTGSPVPLKVPKKYPAVPIKQPTLPLKDPPVPNSDPPVPLTDPPVSTNNPPETQTDPPILTTDPPESTTDPPIPTTDPQLSTTDPPVQDKDQAVPEEDPPEPEKELTVLINDLSVKREDAPVSVTDPPLSMTDALEDPPVTTTNYLADPPVSKTEPPEPTTDPPEQTTDPPVPMDDLQDNGLTNEDKPTPVRDANKQEHCLKACTLVLSGGCYFARQLLIQEALTKYTTVNVFLKASSNKIKRLRVRGLVREQQYYVLYPRKGNPSDLEEWDMTLLTLVLINCITLNKAQKEALKKIRELRNTIYGKTASLSMTEDEFQTVWLDISTTLRDVVQLLVNKECIKAMDDIIEAIETEALSGNRVIQTMRDWYWNLTEEALANLRKQLTTVEDLRNSQMGISLTLLDEIASNQRADPLHNVAIDEARARLERHKLELEVLNTTPETHHTHMVTQKLLENHVAVLTGIRGSGKTHIALNTLKLMLESNEHLQPLILYDPSVDDFRDAISDTTTNVVLFIDDFLGRFNTDKAQLDEWSRYVQTLVSFIETGRIFVVIAIGKVIKNKCIPEDVNILFRDSWTVDLDDSAMDESEKRHMIGLYASYYDMKIKETDIDKVVSMTNINYGVASPCLCKAMGGRDIVTLFARPLEVVKEELTHIKDKDIASFIALLMTLLCDDELHKNAFSEKQGPCFAQIQKHFEGRLIDQADMFNAANALVHTYLKTDEVKQSYSFNHNVVLEATFAVALESVPDILLEFCPLVIIAKLYTDVQNAFHFEKIIQRFRVSITSLETPTALKCIAEWLLQKKHEFLESAFRQMDVIDFYTEDKDGKSMLVHFAGLSYVEILDMLETCRNQQSVSMKTKEDQILNAALHAIQCSSIKSLQYLIPMRISVNDEMMFAAVKGGESDVLEFLLANRGNISARRNDSGENLIHEACRHNNINLARHILDSCDQSVKVELLTTKTTKDGRTPLMYAARHCNLETFKFILRINRKIDIESEAMTEDGVTLLHMAAEGGQLSIVQYLCFHYRQIIHMTNIHQWNAAHSAAERGQLECLVCLLQRGLNPYARTDENKTILHIATENGRLNVVQHICRHLKEMLGMRLDNEWTAAHIAAEAGELECFIHLLNNRVGLSTPMKCTVLHIASRSGKMNIVEYLCKKLPNILQIVDNEQWNAAHYAAHGGHLKCLEYLLEQGIDPMAETSNGETIADIALKGKRHDVVEYVSKKYHTDVIVPASSKMCSIL